MVWPGAISRAILAHFCLASRRAPCAELLVIDKFEGRAIDTVAAGGTRGIAAELELAEPGCERVVDQEPAGEARADAEDELDRLGRLEGTHHARQDTEHPALGAR